MDTETKIEEPVKTPQAETAQSEQPAQETTEQINWKRFREAREKDRRDKEAAEKDAAKKATEIEALKAAIEAVTTKNTQPQESSDETEEQRIARLVEAQIAKKEQEYEKQRAQREYEETPLRLQQAHSDFSEVCSPENVDYLQYHYPEVAAAFKHMPEGFEKWSNIYKAVKRFVPNTSSRDAAKVERNSQKPQSMSIPGITQGGDTAPRMLNDQQRQANWQRMQRVMKGQK